MLADLTYMYKSFVAFSYCLTVLHVSFKCRILLRTANCLYRCLGALLAQCGLEALLTAKFRSVADSAQLRALLTQSARLSNVTDFAL